MTNLEYKLIQILGVLVLLALLTGCASTGSNTGSNTYAEFIGGIGNDIPANERTCQNTFDSDALLTIVDDKGHKEELLGCMGSANSGKFASKFDNFKTSGNISGPINRTRGN